MNPYMKPSTPTEINPFEFESEFHRVAAIRAYKDRDLKTYRYHESEWRLAENRMYRWECLDVYLSKLTEGL